MPEIRSYRVTQTREVEVDANSIDDALLIAGVAFENGQSSQRTVKLDDKARAKLTSIWGNTTSFVKETDRHITRL